MKPKIYLGFLIILAALLIAIPVQAITFGQADGNAHPNVGMLWVEIDGGLYGVCSGTKVPAADGLGQDVFLTAAHCLAWAPPGVTWYVTFDSDASDPYAANLIPADGAEYHPGYNHDMGDLHDLGVVLLPEGSTAGINPAEMPAAGHCRRYLAAVHPLLVSTGSQHVPQQHRHSCQGKDAGCRASEDMD